MKPLSSYFFAFFFLLFSNGGFAQTTRDTTSGTVKAKNQANYPARTDTAKGNSLLAATPPVPDDEFNIFLLFFAILFFSVVLGAVMVGSFAAVFILFSLFALIAAGVLSGSIMVGLYRRSISAGFKTFLLLVCSLGGMVTGTTVFWLVNRFGNLHLTRLTTILGGAASGLLGGILLGLCVFLITKFLVLYFRQKLKIGLSGNKEQ